MRFFSFALIGSAIGALNLAPAQLSAETLAEFYRNKPITLFVGYAPGGGYDTYARVLGTHMPRHIPGAPKMIIKNMPGADSLRLMNYLYNQSPRDGSEFATFNRGLAVAPLLGLIDKKKAKFDPKKLTWIGSLNNEVALVVSWHGTGITSIKDTYSRTTTVGATGKTSNNAVYPYVLNNLLGTKFKVIAGYPGTSHIILGLERGEVDGNGGWSWSSIKIQKPDWIENKKLNLLLQLSVEPHAQLSKMGVPFIMDLAKDDEDRKVLEVIFARHAMGRPYAAPPGLPPERAKALRAAFSAVVKDDRFLKAADKSRLDITAVDGERVERILNNIYGAPDKIVNRAKEAVKPGKTEVVVKKIPVYTVKSKLTGVRDGGRQIRFVDNGEEAKAKVSGSRTKIFIAGKKAQRKSLQADMSCEIEYQGSGSEAKKVSCK